MNIGQTASIVLRRAVVNIKLVHLAIPELTAVVWSRNDAFVTKVTHVTRVSTTIFSKIVSLLIEIILYNF